MSSSDRRTLLRLLALAPLGVSASCGFTPVYGEGTAARATLNTISLAPIDGRIGFAFREAFETRVGPAPAPTHVLTVRLRVQSVDRVIRQDNSITRFNLTGFADYALVPINGDMPVFSDTARSFTAYSATANAFATDAAEADALERLAEALAEQVALRLTTTAERWQA